MKVAVVIPCYRVRAKILGVIESVGPEVTQIIVVDDACPEESGRFVKEACKDPRVQIVFHEKNLGVGGAMVTGYRKAVEMGADVVVKVDGDGQMDGALIPDLIAPILSGRADFVKGNRFYHLEDLTAMPWVRLIGNSVLSLISKASTGYWNIMDPTNGFIALSREALSRLRLEKLSRDYFFETDLLFRLYTVGAVVHELPQKATYSDEKSSMNLWRVIGTFPQRHLRCLLKRIFYSYFLREFNLGTIYLVTGIIFSMLGIGFSLWIWIHGMLIHTPNLPGTVMLAALMTIIGFQLLLSFLQFDVARVPQRALSGSRARGKVI